MSLSYLNNVVTLKLDQSRCTGCGLCTEICPHGVLKMENKKAVITDKNRCMKCGGCAKNCPMNALSVRAGVGCAAAVVRHAFNKKGSCSCS